jgi:hypothetical protein
MCLDHRQNSTFLRLRTLISYGEGCGAAGKVFAIEPTAVAFKKLQRSLTSQIPVANGTPSSAIRHMPTPSSTGSFTTPTASISPATA